MNTMKNSISTWSRKRILMGILFLTLMIVIFINLLRIATPRTQATVDISNLQTFTADQLQTYNGDDPQKPVYLVFEGYVYDVTKGKTFYQPGGPYHFLAGRDATTDLHMAGGGIIKRKYPIVGVFIHP